MEKNPPIDQESDRKDTGVRNKTHSCFPTGTRISAPSLYVHPLRNDTAPVALSVLDAFFNFAARVGAPDPVVGYLDPCRDNM